MNYCKLGVLVNGRDPTEPTHFVGAKTHYVHERNEAPPLDTRHVIHFTPGATPIPIKYLVNFEKSHTPSCRKKYCKLIHTSRHLHLNEPKF